MPTESATTQGRRAEHEEGQHTDDSRHQIPSKDSAGPRQGAVERREDQAERSNQQGRLAHHREHGDGPHPELAPTQDHRTSRIGGRPGG